jgi:hypothetical protein
VQRGLGFVLRLHSTSKEAWCVFHPPLDTVLMVSEEMAAEVEEMEVVAAAVAKKVTAE